jgi:flagellar basal-body rod protein FlgC
MLNLLPGITSSTSALQAERIRMDVVAQNLANVHTTRGPDGQPYQRQQVHFAAVFQDQLARTQGLPPQRVVVTRIEADRRPPKLVFQPDHPDADSRGLVALPDISMHEEMADLIVASRAFEANLAVIKNARAMALQELSIGKRA